MIRAYGVTIFFTAASTLLSTLVVALLAYPLSRPNFIWKRQLNFLVYFTMLFSGGMVPMYLLITNVLHINNTIMVYILPGLVSAYNVMIVRTCYRGIPDELIESAKIDGAKELYICFKIVIPLSKASIASVAFLFMVEKWNDWMTSTLYIRGSEPVFSAVSGAEAAAGGQHAEKLRRSGRAHGGRDDSCGNSALCDGTYCSGSGIGYFPILPEVLYQRYDTGRRKGIIIDDYIIRRILNEKVEKDTGIVIGIGDDRRHDGLRTEGCEREH